MRFKRISTDTVRCIVTQDELRENGLEMDDFMSNDGRTEEFLRKMIEQAEEEVGFHVQGGPMTIQVAVLPENKLALTFSEKQNGNIREILESLRAAMSTLSDAVHEKAEHEKKGAAPVRASSDDVSKRKEYLLEFSKLEDLQAFCAGISDRIEDELHIDSELYRLGNDKYCLILHRADMDEKQICRIMSVSIEFMDGVSAREGQVAYIKEHGTCILTKRAISTMQKLILH